MGRKLSYQNFVQSKKFEPAVIPALQQEIVAIRNEAASYGSLGSVPASMQANVRNQMYLTSESFKNLDRKEWRAEDECRRYEDNRRVQGLPG